jgi:hypothetical protein
MVGETALAKICGQLYPTLVAVAQYTMKSLVVAFGDCDDVAHFAVGAGKRLQVAVVAVLTDELIPSLGITAREDKGLLITRDAIMSVGLATFRRERDPFSSDSRRLDPRIIVIIISIIDKPTQKRCHLASRPPDTVRGKVVEGRKGTPGTTQIGQFRHTIIVLQVNSPL